MALDMAGVSESRFYEMDGLNVSTYDMRTAEDVTNGVLVGDVDFYRGLAHRTGGPVLDLGGGTGRVAIPLAEQGYEVWSLDLSAGMVREGQARAASSPARDRIHFAVADMRSFSLGERAFGLAIAPFRAFQTLLSVEDQRVCLAAAHEHMRPGAVLALHLFDPRLDLCTPDSAGPRNRDEGLFPHPDGGRVQVTVVERRNDPVRQVLDEDWLFRLLDAAGNVTRTEQETLSMRWTYRYEMRHLLELGGFQVESEASDFHGSPPAYGLEQVWTARRP